MATVSEIINALPKWKCHKIVRAAQIIDLPHLATVPKKAFIVLVDGDLKINIEVDEDWMQRFQPKIGGYLVVYEDGYKSFSPQKAFEEGYSRMPGLTG